MSSEPGTSGPGLAHAAARCVIGLLLTGHGVRKLSTRLGGAGLPAATTQMENLRLQPARLNAIAAGVTQATGGVLTATGLLTPLGCCLISSNMIVAMRTACAGKGPWGINGGWEYPLVLATASLAIAERGAGPVSLDRQLGLERGGLLVGATAAALAVAGAEAVLTSVRQAPQVDR